MHGMETRLGRLEDSLVIGEERQQRLRDLTIQANMARVPTLVLIELVLSALEKVVFPGEESRLPAFVDQELLRPVSNEELEWAAEEEARHSIPEALDSKTIVEESCKLVAGYADQVHDFIAKSDGYVPPGYQFPNWNAQGFLDRWDKVKAAINWENEKNN